jgi:hypothetical protein
MISLGISFPRRSNLAGNIVHTTVSTLARNPNPQQCIFSLEISCTRRDILTRYVMLTRLSCNVTWNMFLTKEHHGYCDIISFAAWCTRGEILTQIISIHDAYEGIVPHEALYTWQCSSVLSSYRPIRGKTFTQKVMFVKVYLWPKNRQHVYILWRSECHEYA